MPAEIIAPRFTTRVRNAGLCCALAALGVLAACSNRTEQNGAAASSNAAPETQPQAEPGKPSVETVASVAAPGDSANVAADPALPMQAPRLLPGTGIEVALPVSAVRAGRQLTFKTSGDKPLVFALSHQDSGSPVMEAIDRAVMVFGGREEFVPKVEPWLLTNEPERAAITGTVPKDMLGNPVTDMHGLITAQGESGHLAWVQASYPESARETALAVAQSLRIHPTAPLDPAKVHGLELSVPEGYSLKPNQLHPMVYLPTGSMWSEGQPALDLRMAAPGRVEELLSELMVIFRADAAKTDCKDAAPQASDAKGATKRQSCKFVSGRLTGYQVRLDLVADDQGGLVAVTTLPLEGAEAHAAAYEKMVDSIALRPVPAL